MKQPISLVICGDLCAATDTEEHFLSGNAQALFGDTLDVLQQADLLVGNLEFVLTDIGKPDKEYGIVLKGRTECIRALDAAGFDILGLANNHIRDCGDEGVLSTIACCERQGIETVGGGKNASDAARTFITEVAGWKIGILAVAEHEFNLATNDRAGAHHFDLFDSFDDIRNIRQQCDYLIVLYHGGIEHYEYPSPLLQKKCRKMVDSGADLVLCQHSHCVGTTENYGNGTILYGQGNTLFGYRPNSPSWNSGLIVKVLLTDSHPEAVEFVPIVAHRGGINLMPAKQSKSFLADFSARSKLTQDQNFINTSWGEFCETKQPLYMPLLLGLGRGINFLNRRVNNRLVRFFFSKKRMSIVKNLIRCEAHHEVLETLLENFTKE